jgi:hypothetical protein
LHSFAQTVFESRLSKICINLLVNIWVFLVEIGAKNKLNQANFWKSQQNLDVFLGENFPETKRLFITQLAQNQNRN